MILESYISPSLSPSLPRAEWIPVLFSQMWVWFGSIWPHFHNFQHGCLVFVCLLVIWSIKVNNLVLPTKFPQFQWLCCWCVIHMWYQISSGISSSSSRLNLFFIYKVIMYVRWQTLVWELFLGKMFQVSL